MKKTLQDTSTVNETIYKKSHENFQKWYLDLHCRWP